jgi:hypothetical protein
MLSAIRELLASQFRALATVRAVGSFGAWDMHELPDDYELLDD